MELYIGIDPSMNSTGVWIKAEEKNKLINEYIYIIVPEIKKKMIKSCEKIISENINFKYIQYNKIDLSLYENNNHWSEFYKTCNMINIMESIEFIIDDTIKKFPKKHINIHICQEGISYGSIHTKSVFDLAGLNYLLRFIIITKHKDITLTIATPSEIKKYATEKGNANKELMLSVFIPTHKWVLDINKNDDICDAYYMACYSKKTFNEEKLLK